jgi:hypothetical protein
MHGRPREFFQGAIRVWNPGGRKPPTYPLGTPKDKWPVLMTVLAKYEIGINNEIRTTRLKELFLG